MVDPANLEEWLASRPRDWAMDIAARAALRVLPLTLHVFKSLTAPFRQNIESVD